MNFALFVFVLLLFAGCSERLETSSTSATPGKPTFAQPAPVAPRSHACDYLHQEAPSGEALLHFSYYADQAGSTPPLESFEAGMVEYFPDGTYSTLEDSVKGLDSNGCVRMVPPHSGRYYVGLRQKQPAVLPFDDILRAGCGWSGGSGTFDFVVGETIGREARISYTCT